MAPRMPLTEPACQPKIEARFSFAPGGTLLNAAETLAGPSIETLEALLDVTYTWGYQETRQQLRALYDKAVRAQWISDDVLPWHTNVDLDVEMAPEQLMPLFGSDIYNKM